MDESTRDAREDVALIRQMLDNALLGLRPIGKWMFWFGAVWLFFGLCSAVQRLGILFASSSVEAAGSWSRLRTWMNLVFNIVLIAGVILSRKKISNLGEDSLARKLVDLWAVSICLYVFLNLLVIPITEITAVRMAAASAKDASGLYKACAAAGSVTVFLVPILPLLITANFLNSRKMFIAGILLALLAGLVLGIHMILPFIDNPAIGTELWITWFAGSLILDIAPGVMTMIFGKILSNR